MFLLRIARGPLSESEVGSPDDDLLTMEGLALLTGGGAADLLDSPIADAVFMDP